MFKTSLIACLLLASPVVFSANPMSIPFIDTSANIDGQLSEPHWQQAKKKYLLITLLGPMKINLALKK